MEKSSSTILPDPLNNDDPFFLTYLSELSTYDNLVTDRSFMEVLKDDGDNDIQDDGDDDTDGNEVELPVPARKKAKTDADAAGSSSDSSYGVGSTDSSMTMRSIETVSRSPEDLEMANVPEQLYDALGELDMKFVRHLVDSYFDRNCITSTTTSEEPIVGRDHFYGLLNTMVDRTPDAIHAVRNCRVVKDAAGNKALKFKVFTTATYIKNKNDGNDVAPNFQASTVASHLDESSISKQEIASIKESCATTEGVAPIFSILSYCSMCWHLNEQGLVRHVDAHYKVLSMKPVSKKMMKGRS